MATQTENLKLVKPDAAEGYDVGVFNYNADEIDKFAGEVRNALGGTSGGIGEKLDSIISTLDWMKTATDRIGSMSDTMESGTLFGQFKTLLAANTNIATLLTQTKGFKAIINGQVTASGDGDISFTIPNTMNADKVVILVDYLAMPNSTMHGVSWARNGYTVNARVQSGTVITYQLIEFN